MAGRTGAVLFSEEGVNGQCYGCNVGRSGRHVEYTMWMIAKYGQAYVEQLIADSKKTVKYKEWDYRDIEANYKAKTAALLQPYGLCE